MQERFIFDISEHLVFPETNTGSHESEQQLHIVANPTSVEQNCSVWVLTSIHTHHAVTTPTIFFPQPWDELLGRDDADFLLLCGDAVEQVGQTGEEGLLTTRLHLHMKDTHLLLTKPWTVTFLTELQGDRWAWSFTCCQRGRQDKQEAAWGAKIRWTGWQI